MRTKAQKLESFWYLYILTGLTMIVLNCFSDQWKQKGLLNIVLTMADMPFKVNSRNILNQNVLVPPRLILLSLCKISLPWLAVEIISWLQHLFGLLIRNSLPSDTMPKQIPVREFLRIISVHSRFSDFLF